MPEKADVAAMVSYVGGVTVSPDTDHLAGLLIEQFGDQAAADIVRRVRDCQRSGEEAQAERWFAILEAVFAREAKAAAQATQDDDDLAITDDLDP